MSDKKNIERLFQEKFKDFEVEPSAKVWSNIESKLNGKPQRRIIPLWWKLSGIAAALVLGSLISYSILNSGNQNAVTDTENSVTVVEKNNSGNENNSKSSNEKVGKDSKINNPAIVVNPINGKNNVVASSEKETKTESSLKLKNNSKKGFQFNSNKNIVANPSHKNYLKPRKGKKELQYNTETVAENNNKISEGNNTNQITENTNSIIENKEEVKTPIVVSTTNDVVKKDSVPVIAAVVPNPLEELLKEKQAKTATAEQKAKLKRWQVSSNAAPVYYSSASEGSPLDAEFQSNSKEYKANLGYGIGVKYALNKKFSIKTGANTVAMEYNTNDVIFSQQSFSNTISNVNTNLQGSFLQIQSKSVRFANNENKFDGKLNQKMGYIEVPVELSYKVIDKKFGVEIIGGFSTLFLNENKVSLLSSGLELNIGEASNLRSIHYSTNIGLGFKYSFWKSFQANFEPMFKYQINTFSSDNGNFKPYILGLYTGVSYSF